MNGPRIILVFILSALFLAATGVLVIAHRRLRPYYSTLAALTDKFPGSLSKLQRYLLHQPCFMGSYSGISFSLTYITGQAGGYVFSLRLACKFRSTTRLKIFMYDKNPGPVLQAEGIAVGDHDFQNYFIFSNMPAEAVQYFADVTRRENIEQLVSRGWQLPIITAGGITTYLYDKQPKPYLDPCFVEAALRNLIALRIEHF